MGVWIETQIEAHFGIKPKVTPFVGVWIETNDYQYEYHWQKVTPFVGVWIETLVIKVIMIHIVCHTLRGCVD